jgi:hypothetical protein
MLNTEKRGTRIELVHTNDPYTKLRNGDRGTILYSRDDGFSESISVEWDDGSSLSLIPAEGDRYREL